MDELGHTDPGLALRVYREAMRRREHEKAKLRALAEGVWADDWADEAVNASKPALESH